MFNKKFCKRLIIFPAIIALALFLTFSNSLAEKKESQLIGGNCQYKSYSGTATVVSMQRAAGDQARRFEVKFSFTPTEKVKEDFAKTADKTFLLYGNNMQKPDQAFIGKHKIFVGKTLEGTMQVITSGTCTPVVFDFPGLK